MRSYTVHGQVRVRSGQILRTVDPNLKVQSTSDQVQEVRSRSGSGSDPVFSQNSILKMSNLIYFRGGGCKRPSIVGFEQQYNSSGRKHHHCLKRGVERVQKNPPPLHQESAS